MIKSRLFGIFIITYLGIQVFIFPAMARESGNLKQNSNENSNLLDLISKAIIAGQCDEAKNLAVSAKNFDLAEQTMRLCKPRKEKLDNQPIDQDEVHTTTHELSRQPEALNVQKFTPQGPIPVGESSWIQPKDYPLELRKLGVHGSVSFKITVSDKGIPLSCEVLATSGFPSLDTATCQVLMSRASFRPARGGDGLPSIGYYTNFVNWTLPASFKKVSLISPVTSLVQIRDINSIEKYKNAPSQLKFLVAVNGGGIAYSCTAIQASGYNDLDELICRLLIKRAKFSPGTDFRGRPAASTIDISIKWPLDY